MKKLIFWLFSRPNIRAMAWGLHNRKHEWINHDTGMPGAIHVVHVSHEFSIYSAGGFLSFLDVYGQTVAPLRWVERKLLALAIADTHQSFFQLTRPMEKAA